MKILVIGGTRFIGAAVVGRLVAEGHEVAVLNRGHSPQAPPKGVRTLVGDRDDLPASRQDIQSFAPDTVLHNVVVGESHARSAVETLHGICGRLVMTSSCDVYRIYGRLTGSEPGPVEPVPATEESPLRDKRFPYRDQVEPGHLLYDYDKIPAEEVVLNNGQIPGTVLRLPMVLGPQDYQHRLFGFFRPMLDGRPVKVMQESYATWRSTYGYVDNVAQAMALACTDERAAGRVYNIADWNLSMLEQMEWMRRLTGWTGTVLLLPERSLPEELRPKLRAEQPLVCSSARLQAELGFVPEIELPSAMERTFAWEAENPPDPIPPQTLPYEAEDAVLSQVGWQR